MRRFAGISPTARHDLASLLVILLACLALFNNALLRGWTYYEFDTTIYYYPMTVWVHHALEQGRIALWSPYIYGGFPLFADGESGALFPPNLVLLSLLDPMQAFIWLTVVRYFLAGAFSYFFLRVLRLGAIPSLIGSLTIMLGSFMVTQMHHINVVNSALFLPAVLAFTIVALRRQGWRRFLFVALGGLAVGAQLLTIHIQPVLMTALMVVLYLAFYVFAARESDFASRLKSTLVVGLGIPIVGLGMGAVQVLPLLELATEAARGTGSTYEFATAFGPNPYSLATLLFPYFFRIAGYDYWTLWFRWETTIYVGIVPLALAIIAIILRRTRETYFFAGVALFSLLLALGDYSPLKVYWLLWHIPGFSFARAPGRFSMLVVFSVATLAAYGIDHLRTRAMGSSVVRRKILLGLAGTAICGASVLALMFWARAWLVANRTLATTWLADNYLSMRHQDNFRVTADRIYDALLETLRWQNGRTILTFVFLVAGLAAIAIWYHRPRFGGVCQSALVGLVAVDLLAFAMIYHPEMPLEQLNKPTNSAEFLAARRGTHRVYTLQPVGPTIPNRLLPLRVASVGGYSSLDWSRYRDYVRLVRQGNSTLLDLWNVRYVVAPRTAPAPGGREKYRPVFEDKENVVYENASYLPRAFVVQAPRLVDSQEAALKTISTPQFDPRQEVIVEAEDSDGRKLTEVVNRVRSKGVGTKAATGRATIDKYDSTGLTVSADAVEDSFLVVSDSFYPGWQAELDGQPIPIFRGDYLFRAVFLPKGAHTITFRYDPPSFNYGAAISISFALLLPLAIYLSYVWERRRMPRRAERREPVIELGGLA